MRAHHKKHLITLTGLSIIAFLIVSTGLVYKDLSHPSVTRASAGASLTGWAWSDTIGWISFSGSNANSSWSVTEDVNGDLAGYAWSDNAGWIKFATGCPVGAAGQCNSRYTINGLEGWIRICAGTANALCTGPDNTNGLDGWISLSSNNDHDFTTAGVQQSSFNYGYKQNGPASSNYAWGDGNTGWIDFNQTIYTEPNMSSSTCSVSPASSQANQTVTWTANPSGGNGTYTYDWSGSDGLSGNTAIVTNAYSAYGTKNASVIIGSGGNLVQVTCPNIVVSNTLSNSTCSPSLTQVATGTPVTWTAYASGNAGPYTYMWSGSDSLSGNLASTTITYLTRGYKSGSVTISSGSGALAQTYTPVCLDVSVAVAPCVESGILVPNRQSRIFYQSLDVPAKSTCVSELRTCQDDGTLTGSFKNATCRAAPYYIEQ